KVPEERNRGGAHRMELVEVTAPGPRVCAGVRRRDVLIETRQRLSERASEPERPEREQALGVVDVRHDLANAPLAGRVPVERLILGYRLEHRTRVAELMFQDVADIPRRHLVDVAMIVLGGFCALRS